VEDKTMNTSKKVGSVVLAMAVALGLASAPALAGDGKSLNKNAPNALVGAWRVTITPYVCGSDPRQTFPGSSFNSFLTFAKGGTMMETNSNSSFAPGQRSVGHGYWVRTGKGTYHSVFEAFVYFPTDPPAVSPRPNYKTGSQRLQQDIKMTGADSWVSDADIYFYDTDGELDVRPGSPGCAEAKAERMW
jgi:hypothetical protein